ncbi:MAG: succinate dehydrogenase, hydrophobic membrane anchor protein [Alphaproteobacteria bacterium]|nr:succinate dehydrogenase, hydrophobic membrane anchor protein [Alphaproteobacteria bacterium]NCQ87445.1 succinate dehydrogenase, hydrophobic membrane anchor protein [Alphaproteobacteria bacterium]NCT06316.1 succinate dehydrogenase, hydrophobic membrane anchor protein [Alphaproteobacteria bacterium]
MSNSIQTPLAKAKGLGSSHHGTHHMIAHNITTLTNIPLVLWVMYSVITLRGASYDDFMAWVANPISVVLIILFVISVFKHFALELQVVFEDYVSCKVARIIIVVGMKLFFFVLGLSTILATLKVALSSGI